MTSLLCLIFPSISTSQHPSYLNIAVSWSWYLFWHICWYRFLLYCIPYFLLSSQWTHLPTALCLTLYCCSAVHLQPLAICTANSSSVWHILHLRDVSCLSIMSFILFVHKTWSWAAVMMASVPFFIHPIFSHSHDFLFATALVHFLNLPWRRFFVNPLLLSSCILFWYSFFNSS